MENLYNVMLNQLYPRVCEAERLAGEALLMAQQNDAGDWHGMSKLYKEIWRRIKYMNEFGDSFPTREMEMMDDETPDPDGYRVDAIRELMSLEYRVRQASGELLRALKIITDKLNEMDGKFVRERVQTKFQLDEMERLLRNERERRKEHR